MSKHTTIRVDAAQFEDADDCLAAAAYDVATDLGIDLDYDMSPRWEDDEREHILVDLPCEQDPENEAGRVVEIKRKAAAREYCEKLEADGVEASWSSGDDGRAWLWIIEAA